MLDTATQFHLVALARQSDRVGPMRRCERRVLACEAELTATAAELGQVRWRLITGTPGAGPLILSRAQAEAAKAILSRAAVWGGRQSSESVGMVSIVVLHRPPCQD